MRGEVVWEDAEGRVAGDALVGKEEGRRREKGSKEEATHGVSILSEEEVEFRKGSFYHWMASSEVNMAH